MMRRLIGGLQVSLPKTGLRRTPAQALISVTSKSGLGVYASSDRLFKGAVFGRDSLEVADDLMLIKPKLVKSILLTIASLQGEVYREENEEEPGKIIHEYRMPHVDGRPLNHTSQEIYQRLSAMWGGDQGSLAYYGSVDSTPHFIKTLTVFCQYYGMEILTEQVKLRSGRRESLIVIMEDAIGWLVRHLDRAKSGLVEYHRKNPHGIENQVWKDSREFYVHKNGQLANHSRPISSIEVQSLAYDALILAADILPSHKKTLDQHAKAVQARTFELLWMPEQDYFALGTDYDADGKLRTISTTTANPGEMLDSMIFDNLSDQRKQTYIKAIVSEITGTNFLTDAGIRSRALSEAELIDFWDYHGSYVTWPKETYDIAKGLRRQGFPSLARELENRLLNIVRAIRSYPEFLYVDARGRILGIPTTSKSHGEMVFVDSHNRPERIQAWTVSAIVAIQSQRRKLSASKIHQQPWQADLEKEVLRHIPLVPRLRSAKELSARYPSYPYITNERQS
jgi:glycogen debranching enzyme